MPRKSIQQEIERASIELNLIDLEHLLKLHLESYDREKSSLFRHCYLTNKLGLAYGQLLDALDEKSNK